MLEDVDIAVDSPNIGYKPACTHRVSERCFHYTGASLEIQLAMCVHIRTIKYKKNKCAYHL